MSFANFFLFSGCANNFVISVFSGKQTNFAANKEISTNGARKDAFVLNTSKMKQETDEISIDDEVSNEGGKVSKSKANKRKAELDDVQVKRFKVSKKFMNDYGPQQKYSYELWKNNSTVLDRATIEGDITENPMEWNTFNVCAFISKITDDNIIVGKFQEQEIDGAAFVTMCQDDLTSMLDIKLGSAIKIYNRILHLREEVVLKFMKL